MPQRNLMILLLATAVAYACYVRGEQNPFARYAAGGLSAIKQDSLEQVSDEELFAGAMNGMIATLREHGDEHSQFIPRQDADPFRSELRQQFGGIGVRIRISGEPPQLSIVGPPEPGSPAAKANLMPGDQILAIDGRSTEGMSMADVLRLMRGAPGTTIRLRILRPGQANALTFELVRETIMIDSILGDLRRPDGTWEYRLAEDPRIAYIRITTFADKTPTELATVMERLAGEGVEAAVIDLRDNAGGALDATVDVCDLFLPSGELIVETRGRDRELRDRYETSGGGQYVEIPLAVLVNGNSASASEIMAACFQDLGRAIVIGQRTFGKGTVQELLPVESGRSLLKLTTSSYWRPSGENIHRAPDATPEDIWGVQPDPDFEVPMTDEEYVAYREWRSGRDLLELPASEAADPAQQFNDRQLQTAVDYLETRLEEQSGL